MKKRIEYLFPELVNIFGEFYNMEYISRCSDEIEIIRTEHHAVPAFVHEEVDMIYLGAASEQKQEMIINALMPYREIIRKRIEDGTIFLVTGNAIEIFGKEIRDGERRIPALGIWDFYAERYMDVDRHNSQFIGHFTTEDGQCLTMLGHKSQFSFAFGDFDRFDNWLDLDHGVGMNPETQKEGIRYNRFYATYSLGPIFILNPLFCKYMLRLLGLKDDLIFEQQALEAYEYRKNELLTLWKGDRS